MTSKSGYSGSGWLEKSMMIENMSPLGKEVADLLGDVFRGIYHLSSHQLRKVDWSNNSWIEYNLWWRDLSTVDFDELTRLVVLSHDRLLRINITAVAPHVIKLLFHKRTTRVGSIMERMPTMEEHIHLIREEYHEEPEMPDMRNIEVVYTPEVADDMDKENTSEPQV